MTHQGLRDSGAWAEGHQLPRQANSQALGHAGWPGRWASVAGSGRS